MSESSKPKPSDITLTAYRHACARLSTLWRLRNLPTLARELGEDGPVDDAMWGKAVAEFFESQRVYYESKRGM